MIAASAGKEKTISWSVGLFTLVDRILKLFADQGHQKLTPDKGSIGLGCPKVPCATVFVLWVLPERLDALMDEMKRTSQGQTFWTCDVVVHGPECLDKFFCCCEGCKTKKDKYPQSMNRCAARTEFFPVLSL